MNKSKIKRIGVLTSGGDSPGMNAGIRAVVRSSIYYGIKVSGIRRGYEGLIEGDIFDYESGSVGNILQRGGTVLKTARSEEFKSEEGRKEAFKQLKEKLVDALIVIGGDGTFRGAKEFYDEFNFPIIGIPGTIDNDLFGTDNTIGYDTALNTVVEAIDKIRDTAHSHHRLFFVEVMGRDAGYIALTSGIAVGAESILIPETETNVDTLIRTLETGWRRKKQFGIVVVAEGDEAGGAFAVANAVQTKFTNYDIRVSVLGHIQRGGNPTCFDRVIASQMGKAAVENLLDGKTNVMVGIVDKKIKLTSLNRAIKTNKSINKDLLHLAEILAT